MTKGFVIMAFGDVQYMSCAHTLCKSIHKAMPDSKVSLITDRTDGDISLFDQIMVTKSVDNTDWKLANDYLVYRYSPYDMTIKLEADMYIPRSIDYWWDILENRDLNIATTIRDFRGDISREQAYRQTFVRSGLPPTYNAITYFRKSELAQRFYELVQDIFENWGEYSILLEYSTEDRATTDVVYAIAARIIGVENCTLPTFTEFSMTHMKPAINGNISGNWYEEMVYEIYDNVFRINTYPQFYPIHYHNKEFVQIIDEELDNV